jgi:tRNA A37 N6-isopentenylltransferase MiaA
MSEADISALKEYCKHKNRPASMNDSFNNVRLRAGGVVWDKDQIEERLEHMHHPEDKAQLNRALEVIGKWNEKPKDFAQKAVHS